VVIPDGQDPGDLFAAGQTERFQSLLATGSRDAVDFLLDRALSRHREHGLQGQVLAGRQVIELLGVIREPIQRELFVKRIAERLRVSEAAILESARAHPAPTRAPGAQEDAVTSNRAESLPPRERAERECLAAMLQDAALAASVVSSLAATDFKVSQHQRLFGVLQADPARLSAGELLDQVRDDPALRALVVELVESVAVADPRAVVDEMLARNRRVTQERELREIKEQWQQQHGSSLPSENANENANENELLRAYLDRLRDLKSTRGRSAEV
jgi:DNA primase